MSQPLTTRHDASATAPKSPPAVAPKSSLPAATTTAAGPSTNVSRLRRAIPIAVAVAVMGGLAAWGHSTDWTLPKFSELMGSEVAETEAFCKEHNVLESQCIECNKTLVPAIKDYGWCKEHGVAQCPLEHPDVVQLKTPPTVTGEDLERASRALALLPRAENNSRCQLHQRRIQFASAEAVEKAGIDIAIVDERPMVEAVIANGEVIYDQTHSAHLASRVAGTVWRVERQVGDQVRRGDVLALVDAADIGKAKSDFLQAITQFRLRQTNVNRLRPLATDGAVPGRQLTEADSQLQEAQIKLLSTQQTLINLGLSVRAEEIANLSTDQIAARIQFLGLPPEMAANLSAETATTNLFPLRSPLDGVVVDCKVVPGEVVDTSTTIFGVADISRMWLMLDVRQEDAKYLVLGQPVLFRSGDSKSDPEIKGSVAWISTSADEQTRTVKVRVNLPNSAGRLCANTFGAGRIVLREEPRAVVVPSEAIHWDGCCNVVFVRDKNYLEDGAPKFFHIRTVRLGTQNGDSTEIIAGVLPGEVIASKNSVVLEAQLLKSNLGAGCGCGKD